MTTLVVGATGATGQLLVKQLLDRGLDVRVIVRSPDRLPEDIRQHSRLSVIQASISELDSARLAQHVSDCDAVASCLGHNLTLRGIYGQPRRLVRDATISLCHAIKASQPGQPVRFVLMNTAGNSNRDLAEPISLAQRFMTGLIRLLLPPHADNEQAADYLRVRIGQNDPAIEWVVLRPDTLTDADELTEYALFASPTRSAIFNPGSSSRINVSHFMAELIANDATWNRWKGQMPVLYNKAPTK